MVFPEELQKVAERTELSKAPPSPEAIERQQHREEYEETLYLTGRPTLKQFLRFVKNNSVEPVNPATLTDQWNAANDYGAFLEKEEAGAADNAAITKLGEAYETLLGELLKDPLIRNSFNTVPTEIALIDLDTVVVYQKHIDLTYAATVRKKLEAGPTREAIFRICLPYDHPQPPVKWARTHADSLVFLSPSNDLRFLGTMKLRRENIAGYPLPGDVVGIVGLAVGFGSNFLSAFYAENRLILHNGSHRAYTLYEMGIKYVPCIIQHVTNRHELGAIAASEVLEDPDYYLKNPRPPMLRDYFNPKLRTIIKTRRQLRQVTVKFDIDETFIPAL